MRALVLLPLIVVSGAAVAAFAGGPTVPAGFRIEEVVTGLEQPTAVVFLDADDLLICEKGTGRVRRAIGGVLQTADVLDLPVNADSERGLLGMALHPNFPATASVYLYYSYAETDDDAWIENRLSRFTWNGTALTSEAVLVAFPFDDTQANGPNHDGGIILFGPDGKLYGVTGDLNRDGIEQNSSTTESSGVGGVFRLNDDGSLPPDNPFIANANTALRKLYSYGVRNSFGLAFDPQNGRLWDTENGPDSYDEVNRVAAGHNSGWVDIMGPDERDGNDVSDLTMLSGAAYSDPEFSWASPIGVTSIVFMDSPRYPPALRDSVLIGDNNTGSLYVFALNAGRDGFVLAGDLADGVADSSAERALSRWASNVNVTTDLEIGPDGFLYQSDLAGGVIRRIRPAPGDVNCSAAVDFFDIDPFLLALFDPPGYAAAHPTCFHLSADLNLDGTVDFFDIDPFLECLFQGCP